MTDEQNKFIVPNINKLDPSSADYVNSLETGLSTIDELLGAEERNVNSLIFDSYTTLVARTREIEGTTVEEEHLFKTARAPLDGYNIKVYGARVQYPNTNSARKGEDLSRTIRRAYEDGIRPIEDRIIELTRAQYDHRYAITDLTEVRLLSKKAPQPTSRHFYYIRGSDVYEAHVDLERDVRIGPRKNNLDPEMFKEERVKMFRDCCGEVTADVYLITNPSSLIPIDTVFARAIYDVLSKQSNKEEERGELFNSITKARAVLGIE